MTLHRKYGIRDETVELLGPPPVSRPQDVDCFFKLFSEHAKACPPKCVQDEINLWDATLARMTITQVGRVRRVIVALNTERAATEIVRPSAYRFAPPPQYPTTGLSAPAPGALEDSAKDEAREYAVARLESLGLKEDAISDLAYAMSCAQMEPLDAIVEVNRKVETNALNAVEARQSRREANTQWLKDEVIEDAEIEPAAPASSLTAQAVDAPADVEDAGTPDAAASPPTAPPPSEDDDGGMF